MLLRLFLQRYFMHKLLKGFGIFFIVFVLSSMTIPTKRTLSLSNKSTIDNCDVIYFINGERVEATNIVIDGEFVRYKSCDNTDGPTYEAFKTDVSKIKYANGSTLDFKKESDIDGDVKTEPLSIFAFASGGLGIISLFAGALGGLGILFALGGIIMGFISKKNIKNSKGKLRGKGFANAGIWLGFGFLFLLILALILIILFVGAIL
jgi:hypothetical protein